ncbi:MAG: amino acid permease [Candidatus Aenigmatarchaeota archaeon]
MPEKETGSRRFGAFEGVFIPTFLSIVGVILFLRLGYVVGGAGLFGTVAIILLTISVTLATGLSLSSIASNIRIGAGGAYSIVTKTLGLEIGGSIGIPLYLAQAFSVALYIFGFSEAWQFAFPEHSITMIALLSFSAIFLVTYIKTDFAVKVQGVVFVLICLALLVIFMGVGVGGGELSAPFVRSDGPPFWTLFAIFFPAATGLMSGIGLSGELTDPKKQIPKGIIYGLGATTLIYLAMTFVLSYSATPEQLIENSLILTEISIFPELVVVGILAATFSSALTMLIAAPRVLQALAEKSILPKKKFISRKTSKGEPRNAIGLTALLIIPLLLLGSLDFVAQVLTMFFLITYASINLSVFLEQHLSIRSFRPTFEIPKIVPLYGFLGSLAIMFVVNPYAGIVATVSVLVIYILLSKKPIEREHGDVRSGLFRALSEWAAEKTRRLPESSRHVWKPNLLVPVTTDKTLIGDFPLIKSIAYPHGRITVLGLELDDESSIPEEEKVEEGEKELKEVPETVDKFEDSKIFATYSTIDAKDYSNSVIVSMEAIQSQVFAPNILFLPYEPGGIVEEGLKKIVGAAEENYCGLTLLDKDEDVRLGTEGDIHVWISPKALEDGLFQRRYYDLALLIAYSIKSNWDGKIHLWMAIDNENEGAEAEKYLKKLVYEARLPRSTEINVIKGDFKETLKEAPAGDLHIIPFERSDIESINEISTIEGKSYLFVHDSTKESVLA